jgi:nicotinamide-nucleotide amidase
MNDDLVLLELATKTLNVCRNTGLTLATAESCTGGMIAGYLTAIAGSSDVMDRGFVTYSNQAKQDMLGVEKSDLDAFGAVSDVVAKAMAEGALSAARCGMCVAVTGVAGPGGGTDEKPVGLVYIACARLNHTTRIEKHLFTGDRDEVRRQTVQRALDLLIRQAGAISE